MEPQPGAAMPGNTNNYEFILNPNQQKKGPGFGLGKDPFIAKIIFLVGGAVVVMIVAAVLVNLFFGSRTNLDTFVSLAQREQEIVRISALGTDATSQEIKNAAANTQLSVQSHQNNLLAYLKTHNRKVAPTDLALKKDGLTDEKLKQAKATSSFDTAYAVIVRTQLTTYADELRDAYNNESDSAQQQILAAQYKDVQLLLESWPEDTTQ